MNSWYKKSKHEYKNINPLSGDAISDGYERIVKDLIKDPQKIDTIGKRIVLDIIRDRNMNKHSEPDLEPEISKDIVIRFIDSQINSGDNSVTIFDYLNEHYKETLDKIVDRILKNRNKYYKEVIEMLNNASVSSKPAGGAGGAGGMGGGLGMANSDKRVVESRLMKQAPFESAKQEYWMMINKPEMWRKWHEEHGHHPDFKNYKKNKSKKSSNETYHLGTYKISLSSASKTKDIFDIVKDGKIIKSFCADRHMSSDNIKILAAKTLRK